VQRGGVGHVEEGLGNTMNTMNAALIRLGLVMTAQAASLSVTELLADPERFKRPPVIVSGTISNVRESGRTQPIYTFDLSDGTQTVRVIPFATPPCQSGTVTVEGAFEQLRRQVSYVSVEITARNVICTPKAE